MVAEGHDEIEMPPPALARPVLPAATGTRVVKAGDSKKNRVPPRMIRLASGPMVDPPIDPSAAAPPAATQVAVEQGNVSTADDETMLLEVIAETLADEPISAEPARHEPIIPAEPDPLPLTGGSTALPSIPVAASDVAPAFAEVPAPAAALGAKTTPTTRNRNLEIAMNTTHDFLALGQANVEAVIKSGQIWTTGIQDIGRSLAESAQAQFDHTIGTWKALAGTKSLKEAFDIQSARGRAALEKAVADTSKVTDASLKLAEQALAPITARLTVATEGFAKPV